MSSQHENQAKNGEELNFIQRQLEISQIEANQFFEAGSWVMRELEPHGVVHDTNHGVQFQIADNYDNTVQLEYASRPEGQQLDISLAQPDRTQTMSLTRNRFAGNKLTYGLLADSDGLPAPITDAEVLNRFLGDVKVICERHSAELGDRTAEVITLDALRRNSRK